MFKFNCFCIDLTMFSTEQEIYDFLSSNDIENKLSAKNLFEAKTGVFTHGTHINKVWIDSVTFCVTAYKTDSESKFAVQYIDYMNEINPLKYGEKLSQLSSPELSSTSFTSIDDILDKISTHGLDSLTIEELEILKNQD